MREVLDANLERIDWGHDVAERFYPWVRGDMDGPKSFIVDPRRGFSQPIIARTGIEARIVTERYRAGESVAELAEAYRLGTRADRRRRFGARRVKPPEPPLLARIE
jgi:hypothetical protein